MRTFLMICIGINLSVAAIAHAADGELPIYYQAIDKATEIREQEFPHAVNEIRPLIDLTDTAEPIIGCVVIYELVTEGHPYLETFDNSDYLLQIAAFDGYWGSRRDLAQVLTEYQCQIR